MEKEKINEIKKRAKESMARLAKTEIFKIFRIQIVILIIIDRIKEFVE